MSRPPNLDVGGRHPEAGDASGEVVEFHDITPTAATWPFSEQQEERLGPVLDAARKTKSTGPFDEDLVEEAPPPPYSAVVAAAEHKKSPWRIRWILLIIFTLLLLLLAILLGVLLTKGHKSSPASSSGASTGISYIPTSSHTPSWTSPLPSSAQTSLLSALNLPSASPVPSNLLKSGDASSPRLNTAVDMVSVLNTATISEVPSEAILMKVFFQDDENYLCEKSSTSGLDSWDLGNSGNRITRAMNGTPIAAVVFPDQTLPIRVFFVNTEGYLADIIQEEYDGPWANGSLSQKQFSPSLIVGNASLDIRTNAIDASWCDGQGPVVYVQGKNTELVAFQFDSTADSSTWFTVPGLHGSNWLFSEDYSASMNFASVCMFDGYGIAPVFVNQFEPDRETGWLLFVTGQNSSESVDLPSSSASLYRPNTPISVIFGNFESSKYSSSSLSIFLFYSLPQSLNSLTPNPSLHMLYAYPDASQPPFVNWTIHSEIDLGIIPYALGAKALYNSTNEQVQSFSFKAGVEGAMPRAWTALRVGGNDSAGTAIVVYQTEDGRGIQVADVLGGTLGTWDVIVPAS